PRETKAQGALNWKRGKVPRARVVLKLLKSGTSFDGVQILPIDARDGGNGLEGIARQAPRLPAPAAEDGPRFVDHPKCRPLVMHSREDEAPSIAGPLAAAFLRSFFTPLEGQDVEVGSVGGDFPERTPVALRVDQGEAQIPSVWRPADPVGPARRRGEPSRLRSITAG